MNLNNYPNDYIKYLKYKNKYLILKKQLSNQKGGFSNFVTILLKKFVPNSDSDMSVPSFYKQGYKYLLTNGANQELSSNGRGTTEALKLLGQNNYGNNDYYFEPHFKITNGKLEDLPNQKIQVNQVHFVDKKNDKVIVGVFHILGQNYNDLVADEQDKMDGLQNIYNYYYNTILYANKIALVNPTENFVLFLATIPGQLYKGGIASNVGMILAIKNINEFPSNIK